MSSATPDTRELAARENDRLHLLLLLHPRADELTASVEDMRAGDRVQLAVGASATFKPPTTPSPTPPSDAKSSR